MDEGRAGGGSRDNRSAPTRALLGSYPYQTHTRRDLAITRAASVVLVGASWRRGFSRCSYSSRRGIRVPTYGEYQSDRESALRQGNPRSNRQGSVLRDRSKIRVGGCCAAQPKTRLHLDMRQSTRRTRLPMLGDQPRPHRRIWRSVADLLKAGGGDWTIHDTEMEEWQAAERTGLRAWRLPDLRRLRPLKRDLRASAKSRDLVVFGRVSQ